MIKKPRKQTSFESTAAMALSSMYQKHSYLILTHVRIPPASPSMPTRIADIVAVGFQQSRDICLHGFEVKSSRADWLSEIASPLKSEETCRFFRKWSLVCEEGVVLLEEIPKNWGVIHIKNGFATPKRSASEKAHEPPSMQLLASIVESTIKRSYNGIFGDLSIEKAYKKGLLDGGTRTQSSFDSAVAGINRSIKSSIDDGVSAAMVLKHIGLNESLSPAEIKLVGDLIRAVDSKFGRGKYKEAIQAVTVMDKKHLYSSRRDLEHMLESLQKASGEIAAAIETVKGAEQAGDDHVGNSFSGIPT